ncbi:MAG: acetoacetate--CoA ligase [Fidelibacterota bacterium]
MAEILWQPDPEQAALSNLARFQHYVETVFSIQVPTYQDLYDWSVSQPAAFWESVWNFTKVQYSQPHDQVVDDIHKMPGARWFTGARLNFAENLLRYRDDHPALIFRGEDQVSLTLSYAQLYRDVSRCARALKRAGVRSGDRVAGFMPNRPEAVIAMLAAASLGAIWSSSSPDFGIKGVLDRFSQIEPKILFAANGYYYNGKAFNSLAKLEGILTELPSVKHVVVIPYTDHDPHQSGIPNLELWENFLGEPEAPELTFEPLPFDHPLYIMYSSGTTGLPKSIVHSAGGTLLQHLKELVLHTDLKRDDVIFYFTTCGWMMWNWVVSSLAVGSTVVLYDGSPFHPDGNRLWEMAAETGITVFGTSAKYLASCEQFDIRPQRFDLSRLRAILSTGSPLTEESFDYVYREIKPDILLASISGGTDIISCFALGNPLLPVYRGELQCRGLGMDVAAFDDAGRPVINEKGELVCRQAFPSMPVHFWNDPDGKKYHSAYFSIFPGVWHHGDFITINDHGGVKIFGRSDATLNPQGVRIGTAEIYRVVEARPEITDSLVVGQQWQGDERVILFIKMKNDAPLTDELRSRLKSEIRSQCSPRHVPAIILPVSDIPYTINGKKVEIAVKKIIHGQDVRNRDALANPESLEQFRHIPELQS